MQSINDHGGLALDATSALPLYRQLYQRIRAAIDSGALKPGDRLPSTRLLAVEAALARGTVTAAYGLLTADGLLEARGTAGYVVADRFPGKRALGLPAPAGRSGGSLPMDLGGDGIPLPYQMGLPALDAFPRKLWARLTAKAARVAQSGQMVRQLGFGVPALRAAIASYLRLSRGVACDPAQVFITAGYRNSLYLIQRTLLRQEQQVWVEDPGYPPTAQLLQGCGLRPVPVPVDQEGLDVMHAILHAPDASAAVVTPAHQSPLTVTLSAARRRALLDWAHKAQRWIIEDDYGGEFSLAGKPLPALAGMDTAQRVLYCGSFSKVMFPALRLSYLVVPADVVARFEESVALLGWGAAEIAQSTVAEFIVDGHFSRHIQRMRNLYRERRAMVVATLNQALAGRAEIRPAAGGLHVLAQLNGGDDRAMAAQLRRHGIAALPLTDWYRGAATQSGLLFGYTNVGSREIANALSRKVADALRD